ncbi:hypothetical protein [Myxococcus faecalis]|uniref:hypothetical protein n=1 Tax=Myxococcus faecalis TaxID=3115646 RepID=UPI003CEEDF04
MTTWTAQTFNRVLADLKAAARAEPKEEQRARADFPAEWDPVSFAWLDAALLAWRLHGLEDDQGQTLADRQLARAGQGLSRAERVILKGLASSWCSVFEVVEVWRDQGLRLRDLLLDETLDVREKLLTHTVEPGDLLASWAMPADDHLELTGGAMAVAEEQRAPLLKKLRPALKSLPPEADSATRRRELRRLAPRLYGQLFELSRPAFAPEEALDFSEELFGATHHRAFLDFVGRNKRRGSARQKELEPGSAYVFKLGPIETTQDGAASFYVAVRADGEVLPPMMAVRDAEGLARLASVLKGTRCYCESRLTRSAKGLGFTSRPPPPSISRLRALLALQLLQGPARREEVIPPDSMAALVESSADFIRAAPWESWSNEELFLVSLGGSLQGTREVSVMGNGGSEYGLSLFDKPGSAERLARTEFDRPGVQALLPEVLGLTLEDTPDWASKAVQQHTGIPFIPELLRVTRNKPRLADAREVLLAAAVARAVARARPGDLRVEEELRVGDLHVKVRLEVPLPLFTGHYVGERDLGELLELPGARVKKVREPTREVPRRKVSESLLDFAQPLLERTGGGFLDESAAFTRLALALATWNAVVQDRWEPRKGWVEHARATLRRLAHPGRQEFLEGFEALVERKQRHFADDPRLLTGLDLTVGRTGQPGIKVIGVLAPGAWPEFLGT